MAFADNLRSAGANMTVAAGLIEGLFVSGYPLTWSTYAVAIAGTGGSGSLTFTITATNRAKYIQIGKLVFLDVSVTGTTGGTTSTDVTLTLPVAGLGDGFYCPAVCSVTDSTIVTGNCRINTQMNIRKYDSSNWGLGVSRLVEVLAVYVAA